MKNWFRQRKERWENWKKKCKKSFSNLDNRISWHFTRSLFSLSAVVLLLAYKVAKPSAPEDILATLAQRATTSVWLTGAIVICTILVALHDLISIFAKRSYAKHSAEILLHTKTADKILADLGNTACIPKMSENERTCIAYSALVEIVEEYFSNFSDLHRISFIVANNNRIAEARRFVSTNSKAATMTPDELNKGSAALKALKSKKAVLIPCIETELGRPEPVYCKNPHDPEDDKGSLFCFPVRMLQSDLIVGILSVHMSKPNTFSESQLVSLEKATTIVCRPLQLFLESRMIQEGRQFFAKFMPSTLDSDVNLTNDIGSIGQQTQKPDSERHVIILEQGDIET